MAAILCPKCEMETTGGKGFWGWSKPHCSFCGWNVALAKKEEQSKLRQLPRAFGLFAVFFAAVAYFSKEGFAFFPFLFLSAILLISAASSWKKLRLLEASHPDSAFATRLSSEMGAKERAKQDGEASYERLRAIPRPRQVQPKRVPRAISIAFPLSGILFAWIGFEILRNGIASSSALSNLVPLLFVGLIWSVISISIIRKVRKDRRLLGEGELAIATVTYQELSGGKQRNSRIKYEFKDAAGRLVQSEATDESHTLYEDMQTPVFYNPTDTSENVPLSCASCELRQS